MREEDAGEIKLSDGGAACKASTLFMPSTVEGPIPGLVVVHGACAESWFVGSLMTKLLAEGNKGSANWTYNQCLCREAASQGIAVLMIGLHDQGDANVLSTTETNPFLLATSAIALRSQTFNVGFVIVSA